jgi:hypothetical protein
VVRREGLGVRLAKRNGLRKAKVAVARKLAVVFECAAADQNMWWHRLCISDPGDRPEIPYYLYERRQRRRLGGLSWRRLSAKRSIRWVVDSFGQGVIPSHGSFRRIETAYICNAPITSGPMVFPMSY